MTFNDKPRKTFGVAALAAMSLCALAFTGCASPPAVTPLLRVTRQTLINESQQLADDAQRDRARVDQTRKALSAAFDADLDQASSLTPQWVRDATAAYVAAREALVRHELTLQSERQQRIANLDAARQALDRAVSLIEQQDKLITRVTGTDLWKLLEDNHEQVPLRGDR